MASHPPAADDGAAAPDSGAPAPDGGTLYRLRQLLLALVLLGAMGLVAELALLEHWEVAAQRIPVVLLILTIVATIGFMARPARRSLAAFRVIMILAVVSGLAGTALHYRSNDQLEREINPDRPAAEIFGAAVRGGTPTLAPGAMIQLGLLGLLAAFRHPARALHPDPNPTNPEETPP